MFDSIICSQQNLILIVEKELKTTSTNINSQYPKHGKRVLPGKDNILCARLLNLFLNYVIVQLDLK